MSAHSKDPAPPLRFDNPPLHPMDKPPAVSLIELAVLAAAFLFALIAPVFVVSPAETSAPGSRLALAAGLTLLGVAVALVVTALAYRRTRNYSWLVIGVVPSITLVAAAAVLAGTKAG